MTRVFIKPATPVDSAAPATQVRKPVGGHLSQDGEWQTLDSYWLRREADADVVIDRERKEPPEPAPAPAAAAPATDAQGSVAKKR